MEKDVVSGFKGSLTLRLIALCTDFGQVARLLKTDAFMGPFHSLFTEKRSSVFRNTDGLFAGHGLVHIEFSCVSSIRSPDCKTS